MDDSSNYLFWHSDLSVRKFVAFTTQTQESWHGEPCPGFTLLLFEPRSLRSCWVFSWDVKDVFSVFGSTWAKLPIARKLAGCCAVIARASFAKAAESQIQLYRVYMLAYIASWAPKRCGFWRATRKAYELNMTFAGGGHGLFECCIPSCVENWWRHVALNRQVPICSEHLQCVRSLSNGHPKVTGSASVFPLASRRIQSFREMKCMFWALSGMNKRQEDVTEMQSKVQGAKLRVATGTTDKSFWICANWVCFFRAILDPDAMCANFKTMDVAATDPYHDIPCFVVQTDCRDQVNSLCWWLLSLFISDWFCFQSNGAKAEVCQNGYTSPFGCSLFYLRHLRNSEEAEEDPVMSDWI